MNRAGMLMCIASAACFGSMAIFGKLLYDEGATVGTLLALRFAIAAVLFWVIAAISGGLGALRLLSRRDVRVAVALGALGYAAPGERLLRRAAPHRRVAAGAAALHVPGDRHGRLDRARSRTRRAAPDRCARADLERARPRRRRGGDRGARPARRGSRACCGVRLQRLHPDQRRSQRARPPAAPLRARLQRRGGHADDRRGGARRAAPRRPHAGRVGLDGVHRADLDRRSRSASSSPVCAASAPRAPRSSRRSSRS